MWIYIVIFLATALFLLYKYSARNYDYWEKRKVFYIKPKPFLGSLLDLVTKDNNFGKNIAEQAKLAGDRDFYGIFIFDRPILIIKSPKLAQSILQKDALNFADRTVSSNSKHPIASNMLFFQKNPVWKEHRTKLSPIFTSGKLKLMFPIMIKETEEMLNYINKIANIPDIESKEICAKYSTNVITRTAFAVEANSFKNEDAVFRKVGREIFRFKISTALRQFSNFLTPWIAEMFNISFIQPSVFNILENIFIDVLHSREASKSLKGNDFVDILLEARRKSTDNTFSQNALLGQAVQFFIAGFETVATTLSFTLYELCVNPDVQEKLRDEIKKSLKKNNGTMTYEELGELKYLDMCVAETLRKYPPVPFLDRISKENYKIEGSDVVIEKGQAIFILSHLMHYNEKYFPNPEKYDPERFADKSVINNDGLFYIPFGEGPRICIGQRFGLMETKIAVVELLSKFRIEKSPKTPVPLVYESKSFVLSSNVGIPVKFVPI